MKNILKKRVIAAMLMTGCLMLCACTKNENVPSSETEPELVEVVSENNTETVEQAPVVSENNTETVEQGPEENDIVDSTNNDEVDFDAIFMDAPVMELNEADFEVEYESFIISPSSTYQNIVENMGYPLNYEDNNEGYISNYDGYRWNMTYPEEAKMDYQVKLVFVSEDNRRDNPYIDFYGVNKTVRDVQVGDSVEAVAEKYGKPDRIESWASNKAITLITYKGDNAMLNFYIKNESGNVWQISVEVLQDKDLLDWYLDDFCDELQDELFYGQYVRKCYTDLDGDGLTEKIVVETNGMACFSDYVIYELNEDKSGVIKWDIKSAEDEYGNIIIPDWIDPYGYELVSDLKFAYDEKTGIYNYLTCDWYYEQGQEIKTFVLLQIKDNVLEAKIVDEDYNIGESEARTFLRWEELYNFSDTSKDHKITIKNKG